MENSSEVVKTGSDSASEIFDDFLQGSEFLYFDSPRGLWETIGVHGVKQEVQKYGFRYAGPLSYKPFCGLYVDLPYFLRKIGVSLNEGEFSLEKDLTNDQQDELRKCVVDSMGELSKDLGISLLTEQTAKRLSEIGRMVIKKEVTATSARAQTALKEMQNMSYEKMTTLGFLRALDDQENLKSQQ